MTTPSESPKGESGEAMQPDTTAKREDEMLDPIVTKVCNKHRARALKGFKKYGFTTADNPLSLVEWLNHLQEELMDAAIYIERAKSDLPSASLLQQLEAAEAEREAYRRWTSGMPPSASTNIADEINYGYGELDANGFWEFPLPTAFLDRVRFAAAALAGAKREGEGK